jgi:hypothetical protein
VRHNSVEKEKIPPTCEIFVLDSKNHSSLSTPRVIGVSTPLLRYFGNIEIEACVKSPFSLVSFTNIGAVSKTGSMFPWHSTLGAGQPHEDGANSKRRRCSVSSNTNVKRCRTINSDHQAESSSSEALKGPEASGQSENQCDSSTDSPSGTFSIEDASFVCLPS